MRSLGLLGPLGLIACGNSISGNSLTIDLPDGSANPHALEPLAPDMTKKCPSHSGMELISLDADEKRIARSNFISDMSQDGRFISFMSSGEPPLALSSTGAVVGVIPIPSDLFLRDRAQGMTTRIGPKESSFMAPGPSLSADGTVMVFGSHKKNLLPGDTNGFCDVFLFQSENTLQRIILGAGNQETNGDSTEPVLSADGNLIAFTSWASNLVANDTNKHSDIFLYDRRNQAMERITMGLGNTQTDGDSYSPSLSSDGSLIAFASHATNLVPGDRNKKQDIFIRDLQSGLTQRVSQGLAVADSDDESFFPHMSGDGSTLVFASGASNLVKGDDDGVESLFVYDVRTGITEMLFPKPSAIADFASRPKGKYPYYDSSVSDDGRFVALSFGGQGANRFESSAFVLDRRQGTAKEITLPKNLYENPRFPSLSGDGCFLAFRAERAGHPEDTDLLLVGLDEFFER